jgi:lipid II:glycine glycyltransferase (peptidoglycan interpeptide bridge formation enzyme)
MQSKAINPLNNIHQTSTWAKFRKSTKHEQYFEINTQNNHAYIQKMPLPFGKCWLYCNRGPVLNELSEDALNDFINEVKKIVKKENAVFVRIETPYNFESLDAKKYEEITKKIGFRNAHTSHQPEYTLIIDLQASLEGILAQMKQKGRYNIRLAKKKGVCVRAADPKNEKQFALDTDAFYQILQETTQRDQFKGHNRTFYKQMVEILNAEDMGELYVAEYNKEVIAGIIITFFNDTAIYYYGASSNKHRNVMAPYLLQWHAIQEAKKRGFKHYDLLGIAPPDAKKHPWKGVSEFKMKFGGKIFRYAKAKEYVFKPLWYWLMLLRKKLRR